MISLTRILQRFDELSCVGLKKFTQSGLAYIFRQNTRFLTYQKNQAARRFNLHWKNAKNELKSILGIIPNKLNSMKVSLT